jgi:flavin reductase (DIM6/NTAB) family NADH-FMN oxidoreductase RutF
VADSRIVLDPSNLPEGTLYDLMIDIVLPRPIAMVSTISKSGVPNLAPFSYYMTGGSNPPSVVYCPTQNRDLSEKDSFVNARDTGEFVLHAVGLGMADSLRPTSATYPIDFDEWTVSGLTSLPSDLVAPARIAESPVALECRVHQIVEHGNGWGAARYVIGEAVRIHIAEGLWNDEANRLHPLGLIGRFGGNAYGDLNRLKLLEM